MSAAPPAASVVVITRNRRASLARTLAGIARLDHPSFEVIVVDNASTDGTREVVREAGVRYVFSAARNGISRTRQIGVEAARGEIVAMCDDDCVPEPDWLRRMIDRFAGDERLALVGGRVINVGFPGRRQFKGTSRLVGPNGLMEFVEDPADAEFFGNLNLALRRRAVEEVGGYDPFLKAGREELDLAATLRRSGWRTGYEPAAVVTHHFTGVNYKRGRLIYGAPLMRLYFHLKHQPPHGGAAWRRFAADELAILRRDVVRALRMTAAAVARGQVRRLPELAVEWLNLFAARALVPWLRVRARRAARLAAAGGEAR
ncbi:MAG TPA: glycosyltransferase family 2 protein [Thermoanaerobaculia bacterium]